MSAPVPPLLWTPPAGFAETTELARYERWLAAERGLTFPDYHALQRWSTTDIEGFWGSLWEFFEVEAGTPYERVLGSRSMPGADWFPGARLNLAQHVFRRRDPNAIAIHHQSETEPLRDISWGELTELTARVQAGLEALGVGPGDRVCAYLPNIPEAAAALFATAALGAIWSCCSPDFGVRSVVDRFAQIEPKVLITVDGYVYGGKPAARLDAVAEMRANLPTLEATVLLPYLDRSAELPGTIRWETFLQPGTLHFEQVPFAHPLWVVYSSGTTGLPKPLVHGQGGVLLEHWKQVQLHWDARAGDRLYWYSSTGWMMWNLLLGGLLTEASVITYDGSPGHPDMNVQWRLAAEAGATCFGTSAAFIAASMKAGVRPADVGDLSTIRAIGSTGSPLSPDGFRWIYEQVNPDVWLFSMSGGTDVCTAFIGGVPTLPVHEGELQASSLGAAIEAWDEQGNALVEEVGELVLTEPMPSMPVALWGDTDGTRYHDSYFGMYDGIWRHGDWIRFTDRNSAVIYGRSDSTINRRGIRMGTAELYRAVLASDDIVDALVVDIPKEDTDGWMPLFVVLRPGAVLTPELVADLKRRVREDCSPRHVPDEIRQIAEVPRTLSGKILEVPVKRILMGARPHDVASPDALANPAALEVFADLAADINSRLA
ncbi:MAG: acetoacetate--CoA ligase [Actinobacteria bacterium]|uniref:Unannotated protein n=1 Tax=freshwater metagenome TaxID=449393 RepID=A0A6J6Q3A8_9ZZZZ|nr:acetoacetate--CoA ligase [Actinomycetota bacterium]